MSILYFKNLTELLEKKIIYIYLKFCKQKEYIKKLEIDLEEAKDDCDDIDNYLTQQNTKLKEHIDFLNRKITIKDSIIKSNEKRFQNKKEVEISFFKMLNQEINNINNSDLKFIITNNLKDLLETE